MFPPEPSILAADDDSDDNAAATFITDLSVGSLFTKALLILLIVFFIIRMSIFIFRRLGYLGGHGVPTPNPNNLDHHHEEENAVQNDAEATKTRAAAIEAVISLYPCFMYSYTKADERNNTTCPICMCEYLKSEMIRMMPECGHYFHLKCIDEWLRINWSCPVCRDSPSLIQATPPSPHQATRSPRPPPVQDPQSLSLPRD